MKNTDCSQYKNPKFFSHDILYGDVLLNIFVKYYIVTENGRATTKIEYKSFTVVDKVVHQICPFVTEPAADAKKFYYYYPSQASAKVKALLKGTERHAPTTEYLNSVIKSQMEYQERTAAKELSAQKIKDFTSDLRDLLKKHGLTVEREEHDYGEYESVMVTQLLLRDGNLEYYLEDLEF